MIALSLPGINPSAEESGLRIALFSFRDYGLQNCNVDCLRDTLCSTAQDENNPPKMIKRAFDKDMGDSSLSSVLRTIINKQQAVKTEREV